MTSKREFDARYSKMMMTVSSRLHHPGFFGWLTRHNQPLWRKIGLEDAMVFDALKAADYELASKHATAYAKLWTEAFSDFHVNVRESCQ